MSDDEAPMGGQAGIVHKQPDFKVAGVRRAPVANPLFDYLLRLADDRLVLGNRVSEWCGHGPVLEEDIALSNIALDLIGHASSLLSLAGEVEGQGRDDDALAYFRDERQFRNALLVEQPNGDFAMTIVRQFLFDTYSVLQWDALSRCDYAPLAAIATKSLKEDKYHLRHSSEWMLRLGDGTEESHRRVQAALDSLWRFTGELFDHDEVDDAVAGDPIIAFDQPAIHALWLGMVKDVVERATLTMPTDAQVRRGGRRGGHTEHLGHMLATMQSVARAHPGAKW